jgi:hypothetical protein
VPRGTQAKVGDTNVAPNGYHYTRTEGGWVLTHRLIAEKNLGRPLEKNERIRYKDGDRSNLDPSNIQVLTKVGGKSKAAKLASLDARIADLKAQREELARE